MSDIFASLRAWRATFWYRRFASTKFWRRRRSIGYLLERLLARLFAVDQSLADSRDGINVAGWILLHAAPGLLSAALVTGLVIAVDGGLAARYEVARTIAFGAPQLLSIVTAQAQILGALLGLYLTAVSVVASVAYARVPVGVRQLALQEPVGSVGFKILAYSTVSSILFAVAIAGGYAPSVFAVSAWLAISLLSVIGFVQRALHAFDFLSPAALMPYVQREFVRAASACGRSGTSGRSEHFQSRLHRRAARVLDTSQDLGLLLAEYSTKDVRALETYFQGLIAVLCVYVVMKRKIPRRSAWFPKAASYPRWILASHVSVGMALETGTSVQPEFTVDHEWVERELFRQSADAVRALLERREFARVGNALENIAQSCRVLAAAFELPLAARWVREVAALSLPHLARPDASRPSDRSETSGQTGMADALGSACVNLVLGLLSLAEAWREIRELKPPTSVRRREWVSYGAHFPGESREALDRLREQLSAETVIEGGRFTPDWFIVEEGARGYARCLAASIAAVGVALRSVLSRLGETNLSIEVQAVLSQRCLEVCSKLEHHRPVLEATWSDVLEQNKSQDLAWPSIDWAALDAIVAGLRREATESLLLNLGPLAQEEDSLDAPDFFGHAYAHIASECAGNLIGRQQEAFRVQFPQLFEAAVGAIPRVSAKVSEYHERARPLLATQTLVDMMEMSGMAIILSEVEREPAYRAVVEATWTGYLERVVDRAKALDLIAACEAMHGPWAPAAPRHMAQFQWRQRLEEDLRDRGVLSEKVAYSLSRSRDAPDLGRSALAQAILGSSRLQHDPRAVFMAVFAAGLPDWGDRPLGWSSEELRRSLRTSRGDHEDS